MTLEEGLGTKKTLMVVKEVEFGVYLGNSQEKVLLPKKQVPEGVEIRSKYSCIRILRTG